MQQTTEPLEVQQRRAAGRGRKPARGGLYPARVTRPGALVRVRSGLERHRLLGTRSASEKGQEKEDDEERVS